MSSLDKREIPIHGPDGFEGMRRAGQLAAEILDRITEHVKPGVTTGQLDAMIEQWVNDAGAQSATIGYRGYEHASCISVNHVVCHGIPGSKILKAGDILNIDVTVIVDGWHGDTSRMYVAGKPNRRAQLLMDATYESLMAAIATVKPGAHVGDIGAAIQAHVEPRGFSVVRDFCGHGLGTVFHAPPSVMHFGKTGQGPVLQEGMFFTIEPMINAGKYGTKILKDGWTAVTRDRSLSAQYEHSIGVTADGCEIFTLSPAGYTCFPYELESAAG
ncbi:MAG: type I methionyl aminopeptidase [Alphaproteobacteria bacterium]